MTNEKHETDEDNVIDLKSRIKDANAKIAVTATEEHELKTEESSAESRIGSEFLGSVAGGAILGYAIDWYFETLPWGFLFFLIMGFVSAVYRANALMQNEK